MKFERNAEYYEQLDKRTKEYKEWVVWYEKQSEGLGDTVAKITKAIGLDKVADSAAKLLGMEDCGCEDRRKRLNKEFRYYKPNCLEEEDFVFLVEFLTESRTRVTHVQQVKLLGIYNYAFDKNIQPTSCGGCLKRVVNELKRLVKVHKHE